MNNVTIRRLEKDDLAKLQTIAMQTFLESFSAGNSSENMKSYVEENFSLEKLAAELNDSNSEFFFAEIDEGVIGYLKINLGPSQTELKNDNALEIERIYVLSKFQGKKIGQLLFEKALKVAGMNNVEYVWLGVWDQNLKAINFYTRNGFVEFGKHAFRLGNDIQTDLMMKLTLPGINQRNIIV